MWRALIKGWLKNTFSDGELQLQDDLKTHLLFQSNGRLTCRVTQQWFLKKTLIRLYCLNFFADIYNLNVLTIFILFLSGPKRHLLDTNRGYLLTGTFFQTAINIWTLVNLKFVFLLRPMQKVIPWILPRYSVPIFLYLFRYLY